MVFEEVQKKKLTLIEETQEKLAYNLRKNLFELQNKLTNLDKAHTLLQYSSLVMPKLIDFLSKKELKELTKMYIEIAVMLMNTENKEKGINLLIFLELKYKDAFVYPNPPIALPEIIL